MGNETVFERRSHRVSFPGHAGHMLSGIIDEPTMSPRAVVLFTHCFTCSKDLKAIVRISRRLSELGVAVLRYDWTGLGQSHGHFSDTTFRSGLADLKAAAHYCAEHLRGPDILLGYSLGGVASLAAATEISSIRGVATIGSPDDTEHLADLLERMDPQVAAAGRGEVEIGGRRWEIRPALVDDLRSFDFDSRMRGFNKPTLIIHSLSDETVRYRRALSLQRKLLGQSTQDSGRSSDSHAPPASPTPGQVSPTSLLTLERSDHLMTNDAKEMDWLIQSLSTWIGGIV